MRNIKEDNRLLASLAVFRELYDAEKDVYGIISVFLSDIIKSKGLYSFGLNEITNKLNSTFEFEIPEAVIKTSLGRLKFITKEQTKFVVNDISKIKTLEIDEKQQSIFNNNENIINRLFDFIEVETKSKLNQKEREKISHSFCSFLMDLNNGDEYIEYITAFILKNEVDFNFKNQLNLIREGVILYSGIKYNNNLNDLGTWRTELTIFIETEILFHLAGFNGELYKNLATDFLTYVREINQKASRKLISLKYFSEVKYEIEGFFTKAKYLLEGNERPNPNVTAMVSIINGCKKPSDILGKKSDFYSLLKINNIEEDSYNGYSLPDNYKYNIISQDILEKVNNEIHNDAEEHLRFLNYISIHRAEANTNNFENIGFILLSGNSTTLKVAWNDLLKDKGNVPLATHLSFLTNKFWFKLNKGFGKNAMPKSFDIITKAQILLSKILNDSVGEKYDELQKEYKQGRLTEEQAKARIIDLRQQVRKPEEIRSDTIKDVLTTISEDSLEKFTQEQSYFKSRVEHQEIENTKLQEQLRDKEFIEEEFFKTKRELLSEKKSTFDTLKKQKEALDRISAKRYANFKMRLGFIIVLYYVLLIGAVFYFTWNVFEQYTYIIGLIPVIISVIYLLIWEKSINPNHYLDRKANQYKDESYKTFEFDVNKFEELNSAMIAIQNEESN